MNWNKLKSKDRGWSEYLDGFLSFLGRASNFAWDFVLSAVVALVAVFILAVLMSNARMFISELDAHFYWYAAFGGSVLIIVLIGYQCKR